MGSRSGTQRRGHPSPGHVRAFRRGTQPGGGAPAAGDQYLGAPRGALHPVAEAVAKVVGADCSFVSCGLSGAEGIRTPGLRHAMAALCQLSYSPGKLKFRREVYRRNLPVFCWREPKVNPAFARCDAFERDQIRGPKLVAVRGDKVDLFRRIPASVVSGRRREPATGEGNHDNFTVFLSGLALDPEQPRAHLKDEVCAGVLGKRLVNLQSGLHRLQSDRRLRHCSLVVRAIVHEHMFVAGSPPLAR